MRGRITDRLERLEGRLLQTDARRVQIEEDAQVVQERLLRRAAALSDADATKTIEDRRQMSCAQHVAWALRFDPAPDFPSILALHGVQLASTGDTDVRPAY